ncbi:MAG: alpha-glucosidase, partial [Anaerolineaceae bacterium]|nr:alpha-glucosidase [Anaerolineaceae bacterium]
MMNDQFLWWRDGVIYQIYPRSYADSNADGIGDLPGIIEKLDYIADLGVDAIWLSPIHPSPDMDFGYDVADYRGIDPKFGTMQDFERLLTEAHKRDLRIILDLVLNHTSNQHPWFIESRKSLDNPYRDYYIWRPGKPNGEPPNHWASIFGGGAWEYDAQTDQYYLHLFYPEQVDLNWRNPEVHDSMLDLFRYWCEKGVDGFRLDVFNLYYKHPDLPDNPPKMPTSLMGVTPFFRQDHRYDIDQPEMMPVLREIRSVLDQFPERYAVGETFSPDNDPALAAKYSRPGHLHAAFNFDFAHSSWFARQFAKAILDWESVLDQEQWPNYVLGNHDLTRTATRYTRNENDDRLKVAAGMLLTLRGTPFIYYGEEIGMRDISIRRREDILDPIGKHFWPFFKGRDGCRSPMQWDGSEYAGFSSHAPWLPVHPNHARRNAAEQAANPASLLNFYKQMLKIRRENRALQTGSFTLLNEKPRFILAYLRETETQSLMIALNFSSHERP